MYRLLLLFSVIVIAACQPITIQIGVPPTETIAPVTPTGANTHTSVPKDTPVPKSLPLSKPTSTKRPNPTATPMRPLAEVFGMPLDNAFELLYAEGYSAEMIKSTGEDNSWGVCVYYWENTDYDETHVCLWGDQRSTDPVIEVSLWRFTETTVGSIDEIALRYYNGVLSALGFDDEDINEIISKARDLLTLAQQDRDEEVYDELGNYSISAELFTQVTNWGYTYGSFVIRIRER
ncbi:MAG: hypothetical protein A2Z14_11125 [Chloroflexi bacterium RBG_16_48_8]|nr:MAG: hypothetical protein A2Z14_11125 [Chloroflexi bacterium RBG_16_48_8]